MKKHNHPKWPDHAKNGFLTVTQRRALVSQYYLEGWTQQDIADSLAVAQSTIHEDIKYLSNLWKAEAIVDFDAARQKQLEEIRQIKRVAWQEWHRSRDDAESIHKRTEKGPRLVKGLKGRTHTFHGVIKEVEEVRKSGRLGDPRYLDQIAWCLEQEAKLLKLVDDSKGQAPVTVQINWDQLFVASKPDEPDPVEQRINAILNPTCGPDTEPSAAGQLPYGLKELENGVNDQIPDSTGS